MESTPDGASGFAGTTFTDLNLTSKEFVEDQLIDAVLTIKDGAGNSESTTITAYDSSTGAFTTSTDISGTVAGAAYTGGAAGRGYTITTPSGQNLSFTYKPIIEYLDESTGNYEVYQAMQNIGDGVTSVVFPGGLETSSIRISYEDHNGHSEDFTKDGFFARLMEFEVLEAQGIASQFTRTFDGFTNAFNGSISFANEALESQNEVYTAQMERLGDSILNKQDLLIRQFQNLELVVSNLNSQSSFFQSQVNSLPKAFSFRSGGG